MKVTTGLQALSQFFRKYLRNLFIGKLIHAWSPNFQKKISGILSKP